MRTPARSILLGTILLLFIQALAVYAESQLAAIFSWYIIYALIILTLFTITDENLVRIWPTYAHKTESYFS